MLSFVLILIFLLPAQHREMFGIYLMMLLRCILPFLVLLLHNQVLQSLIFWKLANIIIHYVPDIALIVKLILETKIRHQKLLEFWVQIGSKGGLHMFLAPIWATCFFQGAAGLDLLEPVSLEAAILC